MADDSGKEGDAKRDFAGKYDHVKSEGLEDFMRENGLFTTSSLQFDTSSMDHVHGMGVLISSYTRIKLVALAYSDTCTTV